MAFTEVTKGDGSEADLANDGKTTQKKIDMLLKQTAGKKRSRTEKNGNMSRLQQ